MFKCHLKDLKSIEIVHWFCPHDAGLKYLLYDLIYLKHTYK